MEQRKTAVINVRVRPDVKDTLKATAERETRSISNMLEVMIAKYCRGRSRSRKTNAGTGKDRTSPERDHKG